MTKVVSDGIVLWVMTDEEKRYLERGQRKVNRKEVAKMWGISVSRLSECPYLLPDGDARKGKRNAEWFYSDVIEMVSKGREKCLENWNART